MGRKNKNKLKLGHTSRKHDPSQPTQDEQVKDVLLPQHSDMWGLTPVKASLIIAITGFVVALTGLQSPFRGDDILQIVSATPVHSITNIGQFFQNSSFYNGNGAGFGGIYYRPIMTTLFSIIYTFFGPSQLYFHLLQASMYIASAILLCLIFRYSFKPALSLVLSLIFLVHPLNSQVIFAIPSLDDVSFVFFGVLALWLLLRFYSVRSMWLVALSLFLSLLSKETGVVCILMCAAFLFWFDRQRLRAFVAITVLPLVIYLALKVHSVGLDGKSNLAPIDKLNLWGRLLTVPSMILFYIIRFVFPWRLATGYFWVNTTITGALLPLVIDLLVIGLFVYLGNLIHRRASEAQYLSYLFFGTWVAVGLIPYLQLVPLDMTVSETWAYFAMAGVLGMIGVALVALRINLKWPIVIGVTLVCLFGARTAIRGLDWENPSQLAHTDISVSKDDYIAYSMIADSLISQNNSTSVEAATPYAAKSVNIFPNFEGYNDLGVSLAYDGNYAGAQAAYEKAVGLAGQSSIYENLCMLSLVYGNPESNLQTFNKALSLYPEDPRIWSLGAMFADNYDNAKAQEYEQKAVEYGGPTDAAYNAIMNNQPFKDAIFNTVITVGH